MRILLLTLVCIALVSCSKHKRFGADDNSPIIIADGSVDIGAPGIHIKPKSNGQIYFKISGNIFVGYKCDPSSSGDCPQTCPNGADACSLQLDTLGAWMLTLNDKNSNPAATLSPGSNPGEIDLDLTNDSPLNHKFLGTFHIVASKNHIGTVVLSVSGVSKNSFDCNGLNPCLTIAGQ